MSRKEKEKVGRDIRVLTWQGSQARVVKELLWAGLHQHFRAATHAKEPAFWRVMVGRLWRVQDLLWRVQDPGRLKVLLGSDQELLRGIEEAGGLWGHGETPLGGRAWWRRLVHVHLGLHLQLDSSALPLGNFCCLTRNQAEGQDNRMSVWQRAGASADLWPCLSPVPYLSSWTIFMRNCCTSSSSFFFSMLRLLLMTQPLGLVSLSWRSLPWWTEFHTTASLATWTSPCLGTTSTVAALCAAWAPQTHMTRLHPAEIYVVSLLASWGNLLCHSAACSCFASWTRKEIWSWHLLKNKTNICIRSSASETNNFIYCHSTQLHVLPVHTIPSKGSYSCWCFSVAKLSSNSILKRLDRSSPNSTALGEAFFCEKDQYFN